MRLQYNPEFHIIFESNAYSPPNFLLNADFQNFQCGIFIPIYFRNAGKVLPFSSAVSAFLVILNIALVVIFYCL